MDERFELGNPLTELELIRERAGTGLAQTLTALQPASSPSRSGSCTTGTAAHIASVIVPTLGGVIH